MLRNLKDLQKCTISATDGEIGHLSDCYFQDDAWVVRYLVVETGSWLNSRKVLLSPVSVRHPDWLKRTLPVAITMEQVKKSPNIDTDKPVSRQHEEQFLGYYGYPYYWGGGGMWGEDMIPLAMAPGYAPGFGADAAQGELELQAWRREEKARHRHDNPHLRSSNAVTGYHIHANDGDIGHVSGFLVDEDSWAIRYLVVDTSNWWMGHQVLIAPMWIQGVHWSDETVAVELTRESIQKAPVYDATKPWDREEEMRLFRHYGRRAYWGDGSI